MTLEKLYEGLKEYQCVMFDPVNRNLVIRRDGDLVVVESSDDYTTVSYIADDRDRAYSRLNQLPIASIYHDGLSLGEKIFYLFRNTIREEFKNFRPIMVSQKIHPNQEKRLTFILRKVCHFNG